MYAAVFAANPCSDYDVGAYAHEPCVGVVVGCACLAAEVSVGCGVDVAPQALRCAARLAHSAHEQLLHEESAFIWDNLFCFGFCSVHLVTFLIDNPCYKYWADVLAVVGYGAVCVDHFKQVDV